MWNTIEVAAEIRINDLPMSRLDQLVDVLYCVQRAAVCSVGKPGCKCARGPGHGPKYYLSVSHYGRQPQMDYIPQDYQSQASECLANYHRLREILDEVCAINHELLSRREVL